MSKLTKFIRNQRVRLFRRGISRHHHLRRELAERVLRDGYEIGDFSVGWPDVRGHDGVKLKVGKYSSIAHGVKFVLGSEHAIAAGTTFLLGTILDRKYRPVGLLTTRGDIVVGSDVWISSNALILSGVTIGDGAVVGLGSVVVRDVAPYSIVLGNPAQVVGKRFPDDVIAELLEVRWWDLDPQQVASLRPLLEGTDIRALLAACRRCRGWRAEPEGKLRPKPTPTAVVASPSAGLGDLEARVAAIFSSEFPSFSAKDMHTPLDRLGIDSIAMLMIRTRIEEVSGRILDSRVWESAVTASDIVKGIYKAELAGQQAGSPAEASERRSYTLNMPQMALGGLSESWLFKELGDMHWSILARGLGAPSHLLRDGSGNRIYATFTRFRFEGTRPLFEYAENEQLKLEATMSRYGAGMYFSKVGAQGHLKGIDARLMSSFSRLEKPGSNTTLLKGVPEIPHGCPIPAIPELPELAADYRARRAQALPPATFECDYEIMPSHDINGVGLLYFAAYPIINDICAMRYAGRSFATDFSTVYRDIFYFGNSDADDSLIFQLHHWAADEACIDLQASIRRKSDNHVIAHILTRKLRCERGIEAREMASVAGA